MNGFGVCGRVRLPVLIPVGQKLILPFSDCYGVYIAHFQLPEIGEDLCIYNMLLGSHCGRLQAVTHILYVVFNEVGKEDIGVPVQLIDEVPFVLLCLPLRRETTLADMLFLPGPIRIIEVRIPFYSFSVLQDIFICRQTGSLLPHFIIDLPNALML